jgi:putative transposase
MSWYRRNYIPGGTYFFTLVVAQRRPLFADEANRKLLAQAMRSIREKRPFTIVAKSRRVGRVREAHARGT